MEVPDYRATMDRLDKVSAGFIEDQRLTDTWGANYKDIRIGKSQMTVQDFEKTVLDIHQKATDTAYTKGVELIASGDLATSKGNYARDLGSFIDRQVRDDLRVFAKIQGIPDSTASSIWQLIAALPVTRLMAMVFPMQ